MAVPIPSLSASSSAAAYQTGDSSSGYNNVGSGGFPFGAPASQNFILYGVIAFGLFVVLKKRG